jgi:hypothetical protein
MCKECFVDEVRKGDHVKGYCDCCGKYGTLLVDEHPELGFMAGCLETCEKNIIYDDLELCPCPNCDCQYVRNDCECNAREHYMWNQEIHWVHKVK